MGARRTISAGRRMLTLAAGASAAALAVAALPAAAAPATSAPGHGMAQHDSHGSGGGGTQSSNLADHGGEVLPASHLYVVWWGTSSAWASDVQSGIVSLLQGFNGSSYANTATQYMRHASLSISYSGQAFDSSTPPRKPSVSAIVAEAAKEFPTTDSQGMYLVFTSNFPSGGNYCAWHSYGNVHGVNDSVAYMPNTGGIAGCDPGNPYGLSGSEGLRSIANVTAHEFMESITDTLLSAWYDSSGSEIGDKCAWQFGGPVTLKNGTVWQLQEEWSNAVTGCVQTS